MINNNENKIETSVVEAIKAGKVAMKPKWHFMLKTAFTVLVSLILFLVLIYLISFIGLIIHEKHLFDIFNLGPRGLYDFMFSLPWIVVFLSIIFVIVFYILIKKYAFVYEKPFIYSFFGLIFLTIFIGCIIHIFDDNFRFARFGENTHVIILGPMHRYYRGNLEDRIEFRVKMIPQKMMNDPF